MQKRKLDQTTLNAQNIINKPTSPAVYINHPLHTAIMSGDIEKVKTLYNNVADFDSIKTQYGTTPLHWAAQYGNHQIAQVLLEAGSKLDVKDRNDTTPAEIAVAHRHMALATMFINYTGDNMPFNMLHTAAAEGNAKQTNWLLAYGADPKILTYDQHKLSALTLAGKNNNQENIEALVRVSTFRELYTEKDIKSMNLVAIPGYQTGKDMKSIGYKALQNNSLLENINNNSITHLTLKTENVPNIQKIMRALETNYSVTHLNLVKQKWSISAEQAFTQFLKLSKSIVHLTIDDWTLLNIHQAETITEALKINTSITRLDLPNNAMSPVMLALLKAIKESNSITHLGINDMGLSPTIARAITEVIEQNTSLTHLDLTHISMSAEVIKIISSMLAKNTSLTHLGLENNAGFLNHDPQVQIELTKIILEVIEKNTSLTYLNLSDDLVVVEGAMTEALKYNTSLTHINLTHIYFPYSHLPHSNEPKGIIEFVKAIEENTYLSCLGLEKYNLHTDEVIVMAKIIKVNHSLTHLNLGYNNINVEGAIAIAEAIEQNMCLSYLNLAGNNISTDGAIAIVKSLQKNSSLTSLDLASNNIEAKGILVIALAIQQNMFLSSLNLAGNDIRMLGAIAIAEAIKVNHSLAHLDISRNPMKFNGVNVIALALDHNKFITTLKSEADTNIMIKNDYIAYRTSLNESLVHKLSSFLLNKFGVTGKQPPIKLEDLHYFKFYQKANQELLNECLQANYRTQTNDSKVITKQIHNLYIKFNKFINDHYLHLTTVSKDNILAPDCPQDISSHIFSFLGKQSLWIKCDSPAPVEALEYIPIELFEQRVSGAEALGEESLWRWE